MDTLESSQPCPLPKDARRIAVVGTTCSGKTAMARELSSRLDLPHVELDALYWEPEWTPAAAEVFRRRVAQALEADAWVTDGNYSALRDIVWPRADTIVWLDYRLRVVMWRLLWRTLRRVFTREELWSGKRERFSTQFFSRDSLFLWALKTYWRRRREYPALLKKPEYAHLRVARLRSPKAARRWVQGITHTRRGTASRRIVIPVLIWDAVPLRLTRSEAWLISRSR